MTQDWRNADAYAHLERLDGADLAWECLRRNPAYRAAWAASRDGGVLDPIWGLRFPG